MKMKYTACVILTWGCLTIVFAIASWHLGHSESNTELGYEYTRLPIKRSIGKPVPWPKELVYENPGSRYLEIKKLAFHVSYGLGLGECPIVERAVTRYLELFFDDTRLPQAPEPERLKAGTITLLRLKENNNKFQCQFEPTMGMDESYTLVATTESAPAIEIRANTSWGILRGLETMSQLIYKLADENLVEDSSFALEPVIIVDEPRFKHRGYMLDTSRHYISIEKIKLLLDAMSYNKLNVFHWHFSDDQSFPLVSSTFAQLSKETAYRPHLVYKPGDVSELIRYAADRGIRVMAELDSPGHSYSLRSLEGLLTKCYNETSGQPDGDLGPIDPTQLASYKIVAQLIKELGSTFRESLFHAGGDEVEYDCWNSNPQIRQWMLEHKIDGKYHELSNFYIRKIYDILSHYNKTMVVWQEVFDNNASLPLDSIVHVWKNIANPPAFMEETKEIVQKGYRAILSSCWYLNYIDYGQDWVKFYQCEPRQRPYIEETLEELVIGGEVCMWTEFVDDTNVISRTWPRASAAAERLWSPADITNVGNFLHRLEQIRCRMLSRGVDAEPVSGPGFC